jgi:ribosome-binding factor A
MANRQRLRRMADQIQRELSALLSTEVKDPRIGMVTITDVEVSPDLAHARVYYTTLEEGEARAHTHEGLRRAAGFLRTALARRVRTHVVPEIRFEFDDSVERGARLSQLIDEAVSSDKPPKA